MKVLFRADSPVAQGVMLLVVSALGILGIIGYVRNIIAIFGLSLADNLGEIVVRVAGIFVFFIGAIAGWF